MREALGLFPEPLIPLVHAYNPSPFKGEAGGSEVKGCLWQHTEFKASLGYMNPCIKIKIKRKERKTRRE